MNLRYFGSLTCRACLCNAHNLLTRKVRDERWHGERTRSTHSHRLTENRDQKDLSRWWGRKGKGRRCLPPPPPLCGVLTSLLPSQTVCPSVCPFVCLPAWLAGLTCEWMFGEVPSPSQEATTREIPRAAFVAKHRTLATAVIITPNMRFGGVHHFSRSRRCLLLPFDSIQLHVPSHQIERRDINLYT